MPTENRSSTELSKIVTEALVGMVTAVTGMKPPTDETLPGFIQAPIDRAVTRISGLLAQPAEQHQGDPVAVLYANGTVLTKADCGDVFDICCKVETPLYTHADPNVRWKAVADEQMKVIEQLNAAAGQHKMAMDAACGEIEILRAQLAERDAQLRDKSGDLIRMAAHLISAPLVALQDLQDEDKKMTRARVDHAVDVADARLKDAAYELRRIADALSASAEPSALPDPLGCDSCTHAGCGKFDGPRQVECRAMADNACARPGASS